MQEAEIFPTYDQIFELNFLLLLKDITENKACSSHSLPNNIDENNNLKLINIPDQT